MAATIAVALQVMVVAVLAVAAVTKLREPGWLRTTLPGRWLIAPGPDRLLERAVPAGELIVAVLCLVPVTRTVGLVLATGVFAGLTVGVILLLRRRVPARCACFGGHAAPLGRLHVARNAILTVVTFAGALLAGSRLTSGASWPEVALGIGAGLVLAVPAVRADELADLVRPGPFHRAVPRTSETSL